MIEIIRNLCPFPTAAKDGTLHDGVVVTQGITCTRCTGRSCWSHVTTASADGVTHFVCPKGLSLLRMHFADGDLLCNGMIVWPENTVCPPDLRKRLKSHRASMEEARRWHAAMSKGAEIAAEHASKQVADSVKSLHDVRTGVSLVMRNAERTIADLPGSTDDERIEGASEHLKALLKAVQLLNRRLTLPSLVANPESATHGRQHATPVFKVFHRMVKLFEEVAATRRVRILMGGHSLNRPLCYESFESLALVLLDNAVKYSADGQRVDVTADDLSGGEVRIAVVSWGPSVPDGLRKGIFEAGVRTPNASQFASSGSGLGLYIGAIVAKAHGFEISYECSDVSPTTGHGKNTFWFIVPSRQ